MSWESPGAVVNGQFLLIFFLQTYHNALIQIILDSAKIIPIEKFIIKLQNKTCDK
jgi:flagellar biosynthesis protein FliR